VLTIYANQELYTSVKYDTICDSLMMFYSTKDQFSNWANLNYTFNSKYVIFATLQTTVQLLTIVGDAAEYKRNQDVKNIKKLVIFQT